MKCFVTGGAGFIGSNLVEALLDEGNDVTVIDDLSTGNSSNIKPFGDKVAFIKGSILDFKLLDANLKNCDVVFHQAAIPSVTRSMINPLQTSEVNIQGTINILHASKKNGVKKVIFASSSSVYGDTKELPKKESMPPNPKSPYSLSKLVGEKYCQLFHKVFGLNTVCLRYFNVYGKNQNPDSEYAAVIPKFIKCVLKKERPTIFGDGTQTRDFTFVKDVVKANVLAAKSKINDGKAINIACQKQISINELLNLINKINGTSIKPLYSPPRPGDIKDSLADISLARELLGYKPAYSLEDGLRETISWFSDRGKL